MSPAGVRVLAACTTLTLLLSAADSARAQTPPDDAPSGFFLTIAARQCPNFQAVRANIARNNIQQSLYNLGANSPYTSGTQLRPQTEAATNPACGNLVGWKFTLGSGIDGTLAGTWGNLSLISGPLAALDPATHQPVPVPATQTAVVDRDSDGDPIDGSAIPAAVTVELTNKQARNASAGKAAGESSTALAIQGGTLTDPQLNSDPLFAGGYAFAALRCTNDVLNGDNVEWVRPSTRHIYCYAYYVTPPPKAAKIIVRKRLADLADGTRTFTFEGNVSYTETSTFTLAVVNGSTPSQTFYRAATRPGDPPWTFTETDRAAGYVLTGITCTSVLGSEVTTSRADANVTIGELLEGDTVDCTFTDRYAPQAGTLQISKATLGAVGTFAFDIVPAGGGPGRTARVTTTTPGLEEDAIPGPIALDPGNYEITETLPEPSGGRWGQPTINCDARPLGRQRIGPRPGGGSRTAPHQVTITANTGVACRYTNRFIPDGRITISKTARGGDGPVGFVISSRDTDTPIRHYVQNADARAGQTVPAAGDGTDTLPLGSYSIQELATVTDDNRAWELTAVICDGEPRPFHQGRVLIELTESNPAVNCRFENVATDPPDPPDPPPPAPPQPSPAPPPSPPRPDLVLDKRALDSEARTGEPVTFLITVTNRGGAAAENVALADLVRRGGQIQAANPSQGSCRVRRLAICRLGTIGPGERATVRVRVLATADSVMVNSAAVGSRSLDVRLRNNLGRSRVSVLAARERNRCRAARATGPPVARAAC